MRAFLAKGGHRREEGSKALRLALDYALARLARRGTYAELYLKYFPISPF